MNKISVLFVVVIGHQKQWQFLKKSAEINRLAHAYLFYGQEKIGKKTLALEFVKFLFGEDIQKRPHPDFVLVEPSDKEIQISQIRNLNFRLALRPFLAPLKAAIIDKAHTMNQEAQSCFLKTLEEPKGKTLLILITEYPEMLFPTILSRVQKIRFYPVKKAEIEDYLKNQRVVEKESQEIAEISLGRPGKAIDLASDPQKLKDQRQKIKELIQISASDLASRFQYAKDLSKEPQVLRETLDIWLRYFRDVLLKKTKPSEYSGDRNDFQILDYSLIKLKNVLKLIQNTDFLLSTTNVNPRLALEILMMEL